MGRLLTTSALALALVTSAPVGAAAQQGGNGNGGGQGNQEQADQSQGNEGKGQGSQGEGGQSNAGNSDRQDNTDDQNDDEGGDRDNRGHGNNRNEAGEKTDDRDNPGAMKKGSADSDTDGNSGNDGDKDEDVANKGPAAGDQNINFGTIISTLNSDKKLDELQEFLTGLSKDELKALIARLEMIEVDDQLTIAVRGGSSKAFQNAVARRSDELKEVLQELSEDPDIAAAIQEELGPEFDLEDIVAVDFVRDRGILMVYVRTT